jgi:hypothetical protein
VLTKQYFIYRALNLTVSEDAGIEPGLSQNCCSIPLTVSLCNVSAESHPHGQLRNTEIKFFYNMYIYVYRQNAR